MFVHVKGEGGSGMDGEKRGDGGGGGAREPGEVKGGIDVVSMNMLQVSGGVWYTSTQCCWGRRGWVLMWERWIVRNIGGGREGAACLL
jgi:hypothetical protein